jgi:two-component SAPR family response regulator
MIHAIAIDDEPLPLEILQAYCSRTDTVILDKTFTKIADAQKHMRKFPVDLLFLDIHMPQMSGIEFYKSIEQQWLFSPRLTVNMPSRGLI